MTVQVCNCSLRHSAACYVNEVGTKIYPFHIFELQKKCRCHQRSLLQLQMICSLIILDCWKSCDTMLSLRVPIRNNHIHIRNVMTLGATWGSVFCHLDMKTAKDQTASHLTAPITSDSSQVYKTVFPLSLQPSVQPVIAIIALIIKMTLFEFKKIFFFSGL